MTSRLESAARTRRALVDAAAELLDAGGPDAVTLREVGALAGVSRNASYRHFADKVGLLTAVAVESWQQTADALRVIGSGRAAPSKRLQRALMMFVDLGRRRPHLYRLMFVIPDHDPDAGASAAAAAQDAFFAIVADVVGRAEVPRYGALLFSSAHGIAGLEIAGHVSEAKWGTTAEELIATLVTVVSAAAQG